MALASTQVWEVRTTGNPANSGGFNSAAAGTDRSQQDTPHVDIDGAAITCVVQATTTDVAITGYTTVAADIGNTVRIAGGTMTAGTYEITAIPAAGQWRLDRSGGTAGQTGTGRMGGAGSDMALITVVTVAFNKVWVKSGAYTITSATQNVAGGCPLMTNGAQVWEGYQTTRGDRGTAPVFTASGINTATLLHANGNDGAILNFEANGAGLVAIRGIVCQGRSLGYKLTARNCTNGGVVYSVNCLLVSCFATGCSTAVSAFFQSSGGAATLLGCVARTNTVSGFGSDMATYVDCISADNTGAASDGFTMSAAQTIINCVAYGNGRDGFRGFGTAQSGHVINSLAENNVGFGFNMGNITSPLLINCASFNNTLGAINGAANLVANIGFVTGTGTFFVNAAAGNFALNSTVGGGAGVRQNALPQTFLDGLSTAFLDRGAVQTSGSSGGGGGGAGGPVLGQVWGGGA